MVRSTYKTHINFMVVPVALAVAAITASTTNVSADQNVNFNVNLDEVLTVSITNPDTWASGNTDELLRNKVNITALTNNYHGATVSMYADYNQLFNTATYTASDSTSYIDTLDANTYTHGTFPTNAWGYSLTDTDAGDASASYLPVTTSTAPVTLMTSTIGNLGSKDVYFGAKATNVKQSGTYAQTVNFVAVTGTIDSGNPQVPVNPSHDSPATNVATYDSSRNTTSYTRRTRTTSQPANPNPVTGDTTTTSTSVTSGDTRNSYANAAGVTTTSTGDSALATALAVAAGVTAVAGVAFFVLAKRKNDDE